MGSAHDNAVTLNADGVFGQTARCGAALDITDTIAAIGAAEASDLATRVDTVLAQSAAIDVAWAEATVTDEDPLDKVWQADDDARRELSYDAVEVLREVRAVLTQIKE